MKQQPFESEYFFHIYNRGNNKENIFFEKENYNYFLFLLKKYLLQIADVYSYCLLPNHFHILIKIKDDKELPIKMSQGKQKLHQPISNMLNAYAKAINKKYNRTGSLFQEHLKRIKIEREEYLRNLIIYINTNSSHHQIEDYKTYNFSSYKSLTSNKKTLIERNEVISLFNDLENLKYVLEHKKVSIDNNMQEIIIEE
ncbi:MAG: transposase [Flavobacteriaceae bacterium]|nr:transposase [Flavobacteriaceae bacterium]